MSEFNRLKTGRRLPALDVAGAEALAAGALAFLAEDQRRLLAFLDASGSSPEALRRSAGSRETALAVLEHLLGDESQLLIFTTHAGIPPERVHMALHLLQRT
jgi:hypothetical protein